MAENDAVPAPVPAPAWGPAHLDEGLVYRIGRVICRPFCDRYFDLKVYGERHVPSRGGVLIVSNHQSYLDPVLLGSKLRRPLSFLAKSELFEIPYFGWLIRNLNAFPVRQGEGDVGAVRETIRRLREGHALILFPEGTRSPDGTLQPIQSGVGLIIRRAGVPVVPAVIDGSFAAWPRDRKLFRSHPVRVMYGPAMDLKDLKGKEIVERIDRTFGGMFEELHAR